MTRAMLRVMVGMATLSIASPSMAVPAIWEANFGSSVLVADDSTTNINFGFLFPFLGNSYGSGEVSSNGFLSLGGSNGAGCCDADVASFLSGAARIAPAWYDFVADQGVFLNTSVAGRAVITWDGHEFSNTTASTFQLQIFSNGNIIFGYDNLQPLEDSGGHRHDGLTGVTGGGDSPDPGEIDYTTSLPFDSGTSGTVYEFFARGPNGASGGTNVDTWDLSQTNICFAPNGNGGWNVSGCSVSVPEPGTLTLLALSLLGVFVGMRRRAA